MAPLFPRSIAQRLVIIVSGILAIGVLTPTVHAQHVLMRPIGGGTHISSPPAPHIPMSPAPILHSPIFAPRMPINSYAGGAIGALGFRPPRRPIRPFPPALYVFEFPYLGASFWGTNSCWWATCDYFLPWTLDYTTISSPGPITYFPQAYEAPYVYGEERPDLPQLLLKDGTVLSVTDYWLIDEQLHFTMIEQEGGVPVEHVIPFDDLDLQKTVDLNTRRGFRFMLRNEPFEQYLRDHPEGPPPVLSPPGE